METNFKLNINFSKLSNNEIIKEITFDFKVINLDYVDFDILNFCKLIKSDFDENVYDFSTIDKLILEYMKENSLLVDNLKIKVSTVDNKFNQEISFTYCNLINLLNNININFFKHILSKILLNLNQLH